MDSPAPQTPTKVNKELKALQEAWCFAVAPTPIADDDLICNEELEDTASAIAPFLKPSEPIGRPKKDGESRKTTSKGRTVMISKTKPHYRKQSAEKLSKMSTTQLKQKLTMQKKFLSSLSPSDRWFEIKSEHFQTTIELFESELQKREVPARVVTLIEAPTERKVSLFEVPQENIDSLGELAITGEKIVEQFNKVQQLLDNAPADNVAASAKMRQKSADLKVLKEISDQLLGISKRVLKEYDCVLKGYEKLGLAVPEVPKPLVVEMEDDEVWELEEEDLLHSIASFPLFYLPGEIPADVNLSEF